MSAFIEFEKNSGFLLDEEKLRRLHKTLSDRFQSFSDDYLVFYEIYRYDSYFYITTDISDLLNEENYEWKKIQAIIIHCISPKPSSLQVFSESFNEFSKFSINPASTGKTLAAKATLVFSSPKKRNRTRRMSLDIRSEDRDFAYLLGSELKSYLNNEVALKQNLFYYDIPSSTIIEGVLSLGIAGIIVHAVDFFYGISPVFELLVYLSTANFFMVLLGRTSESDPITYKFLDFLLPKSNFLIGKERLRYEKSKQIRSNILWVIVIGFCVSFFASVVFWLATKG